MVTLIEKIQNEYHTVAPLAERFSISLKDELEELLQGNKIPLGVAIEHRVKRWDSIVEKIERKTLSLNSVMDLQDLIGLRLILLFSRDVAKTCELIAKTFTVLHRENTQARLGESQFGYQSFHFLIQLPKNWLSVPSFASVGQFKAEIQIRTVAQHIWAAASHVLQYKQESNVPLPVRRSIYRVSAILETVDLEFDRVLEARDSYISGIDMDESTGPLNVDLLASILDSLLPRANKKEEEPYADLLLDLLNFGIDSPEKLEALISKNLQKALKDDNEQVERMLKEGGLPPSQEFRIKSGVFFAHVGLIRRMLNAEFGDKYAHYQKEKFKRALETKTTKPAVIRKATKKNRGSKKKTARKKISSK